MRAELIYHEKLHNPDDSIIEIKIWSVPVTPDKPHGYKYSLVYIKDGNRIIGYDNAEGKGDHRHYNDKEEPYTFESIRKLFKDFYHDIKEVSNES